MMGRGKVKADHRADNRGGPWAGLPHCVLDSLAYRHLSLWGRAVLVEVVRKMNGYNNGQIALSQREIAERLNTTNFRAIGKAIAELMQHGFLDIAADGKWKQRLAREYRLTFVTSGAPGHYKQATNEYRVWRPEEKFCADDASAEKAVSADDVSARARKSADDVSARIAAHRRKTAILENAPADDVSSLICKPYPRPKTPRSIPDENGGRIAGGPFDISNEPIREQVASYWQASNQRCRQAMAKAARITPSELQSFVEGRLALSIGKQMALRTAAKAVAA